MIKFFRRIRKKLIDDGNLKRYSIYAIGEITLVVIGILIALQINNWNETQKRQKEAIIYIGEIHKEFKENKQRIEGIISEHEEVLRKCESIIKLFPITFEKSNLDTLSKLINGTWNFEIFNPTENAVNSFLNSSSFQSIHNEKLKKKLNSWDVISKNYREVELNAKDFVLDLYDPFLNENFNYDFDLNDPRTNLKILQTFKFENLIQERAWRQRDILKSDDKLNNLLTTIDEIIKLTE